MKHLFPQIVFSSRFVWQHKEGPEAAPPPTDAKVEGQAEQSPGESPPTGPDLAAQTEAAAQARQAGDAEQQKSAAAAEQLLAPEATPEELKDFWIRNGEKIEEMIDERFTVLSRFVSRVVSIKTTEELQAFIPQIQQFSENPETKLQTTQIPNGISEPDRKIYQQLEKTLLIKNDTFNEMIKSALSGGTINWTDKYINTKFLLSSGTLSLEEFKNMYMELVNAKLWQKINTIDARNMGEKILIASRMASSQDESQIRQSPQIPSLLANLGDAGAQDQFIQSLPETEKAKATAVLKAPISDREYSAIEEKFRSLNTKPPTTPAEIQQLVGTGKIGVREAVVCQSLIDRANNKPSAVESIGFAAVIERLIKLITQLVEKLTKGASDVAGKISEATGTAKQEFKNSPIAGVPQVAISKPTDRTNGTMVAVENPGAKAVTMTDGTVERKGTDYVTIKTSGNAFITYQGIEPGLMLAVNSTVVAGAEIGTTKANPMRILTQDDKGNYVESTSFFGQYAKAAQPQ